MPDTKSPITLEQIIEIALKHRWFIIVPFCLSMIVGIFLTFKLPKIYSAETLILIEPQRVPTSYVQSLVSTDIGSRISTMKQQILSRTNVEKIIDEFKLLSGPEYENMYLEDKAENVAKRISVKVTASKRNRAPDSFSISYKGRDPHTVMKIANALASYFINANLKIRESQAIGTSKFIDNERIAMRKKLEEVEIKLKEYREKYMGELPEQLDSNLRILDRLQEDMSHRQQRLSAAKIRLAALANQMQRNQILQTPNGRVQSRSMPLTNLEQLKQELANLKNKYTDRHPDVIRLSKKIADLETKNEKKAGKTVEDLLDSSKLLANRTGVDLLITEQYEIKREIAGLQQGISELNSQTKKYQARVENTPKREQELMSLRRDYQNIQKVYNSLLNRKLEAEIAVNMEKRQKGEQFRIIDFARLPEKPISPDMKKLFLLCLAAGLGIGGGFVFLFYFFDTSFRKPEEVESALGVPVLATLPAIYHPKDIKKQRLHMVVSIFSIMVSFVLLVAFAVLTIKGTDQTMELVQKLINI